jgi:hypothetical protein
MSYLLSAVVISYLMPLFSLDVVNPYVISYANTHVISYANTVGVSYANSNFNERFGTIYKASKRFFSSLPPGGDLMSTALFRYFYFLFFIFFILKCTI